VGFGSLTGQPQADYVHRPRPPQVQVHIQRAEAAPVVVSESGVVSVGAGVPYLAHAKKTPFHCCLRIKRCITDIWAPRAVVLVGALVLMLALVLHLALPNSHASRSTVAALVLVACVLFAGYCVYHQCFSEETDGGDATYHTELTAEGGRV